MKMCAHGHPNWSQTTVWQVESGSRSLKLEEASALAELFEQPIEVLLTDDGLQRVRKATEKVLLAEVRLAAAAVAMDRAQKEFHSAASAYSGPSADLRLSPRVEALVGLSVEFIASQALVDEGGAAGIPRTATEVLEYIDYLQSERHGELGDEYDA
jgi:hypothetical protein